MSDTSYSGNIAQGTGAVSVSFPDSTVLVPFPITIKRFDREKFQKEGHFVPRMIDAHGMPRDWEGPLVFVGILDYEMRDADENVVTKKRVLRVLADTPDELFRLMEQRIKETFFALFLAQRVQSTQGEDLKRVVEENARLKAGKK